MKVAIVYDRINKWGGAETVLLALHKIFPKAPLFTSVYEPTNAKWAEVFAVKTSFLNRFSFARTRHEYLAPLMPLAFESFNFDDYDIVISVTSEAAKGVITKPHTKHLCICLTPTRYLWVEHAHYFRNPLFKLLTKPLVWYLKKWDKIAAQRPDTYISISKTVKSRVKRIYNKKSALIYPPVYFSKRPKKTLKRKDYFLIVSRLVSYKKIDLAIRAANNLNVPLKIVGEGRETDYLKSIAKENIKFEGFVSEKKLVKMYQECKALIFPGKEDLGLTMIEAQYFGAPVIAYGKGGAREIVKHNKTGILFRTQTVSTLTKVLKNFDPQQYNDKICFENAQRFSHKNFKKQLLKKL